MYSASGEQKLETPKETADMKRRWTFKSVVLGDSGVGKTWLVDTALAGLSGQDDREKDAGTDEAGDHSQEAGTVGVTFNLAKMELEGGSTVMLQVWDTSGKERYRGLLANYMIDLSCAIIAFDPCRDSAEACCAALAGWHQLVLENLSCAATSPSILFCVVAIFGCDADGGGRGDSLGGNGSSGGGCRGCRCDHLRCLSAGRAFAETLRGRFFQCRQVPDACGRRTCQWLDGQQLSAAWLGCELLRRKFCPPSRPLVRLGTAGTAEEAPLRRRQARSCCQLLATQLHSLLRLPAMAFLLLLSRRAPDQE
ncbi:hypothetical protein BOX15_Mlig013233g1 [Macrostomum lignano]|uniref:Uncharacterized protein n=2 Tax=Macrostomum lignano TaxID=282301 RepID=A0A267E7J7_9PLAT|nr:hypothetical protein BOX15_Mlig013233g2 [Macrostomum lignano]PAA57565.1 hypothetical protein BOX15_Mlig013233g1 [Macrostomum lignano]